MLTLALHILRMGTPSRPFASITLARRRPSLEDWFRDSVPGDRFPGEFALQQKKGARETRAQGEIRGRLSWGGQELEVQALSMWPEAEERDQSARFPWLSWD
jgi:hypothetical protein